MNDLDNMVVLITGATSGIGRASAIRFAKAGATVILTGRDIVRGQQVTEEVEAAGGKAQFIKSDLSDDYSIESLVQCIKDSYGKLDALFNNAGSFDTTKFRDITREHIGMFFDTYLAGTVSITQKCLDLLLEANGVILNNASICGLDGFTDECFVYAMQKAAIIKYTKQLAKKYSVKLRVNALCPGTTRTSILSDTFYDQFGKNLPRGREGTPEEVAAVANFLISKDASYITGAVIVADGGESL